MYSNRFVWLVALWLSAALAVGCNKLMEQAKEAADKAAGEVAKVTESVSDTATAAKEQLNMAGSMELTVGEPMKTNACYARIVSPGAGRATVLQLQSYGQAGQESFPSVFLQAQVAAATPAELAGQVVKARLFVQRATGGPVLFSENASPIELEVVSIADKILTAKILSGTLRDSATGASVPVSAGTFTGVLQ
jgi:hypothetical protein